MAMYPGRFPNEIVEGLDVAMHNQVLAAQKVMRVEEARLAFLRSGTDPGDLFVDIIDHDKLVGDHTMRVVGE